MQGCMYSLQTAQRFCNVCLIKIKWAKGIANLALSNKTIMTVLV